MVWARTMLIAALLLGGCVHPRAREGPGSEPGPPSESGLIRLANLGLFSAEPSLAVMDGNPPNAILVANIEYVAGGPNQETRFDIATHASTDQGRTWRDRMLPATTRTPFDAAGTYNYVGDPVLAKAPDGSVWLAAVAAQGAWRNGMVSGLANTVVFLTRSVDQGATWSSAPFSSASVGGLGAAGGSALPAGTLNDKEWVAVGPDGTVYLCWTTFVEATPALFCAHGTGTADWTRPQLVAHADAGRILTGITLAAGPPKTLYMAASDTLIAGPEPAAPDRQRVWVSRDAATTFTEVASPGPALQRSYGTLVSDSSVPGRLAYLGTQGGPASAYVVLSDDAGATWSKPQALHANSTGAQQQPAGWFDTRGVLRFAFYDAGWPGGESAGIGSLRNSTLSVHEAPTNVAPGFYRRDYMAAQGTGTEGWAAWVGGDAAQKTWIEILPMDEP